MDRTLIGIAAIQQDNTDQPRAPNNRSEDVSKPETADERIARYTLWLSIFTGALVLVSAVQIRFLIKADKTANITAQAAKDSVDTAGTTAERQLRAYVGVHQFGYQGLENDESIGVGFSFINHGQTPALQFNLKGVVELLPYPLPEDFALPAASDRPRQDAVIFPNQTNPLIGWVFERDEPRVSIETKREILSSHTTREIYAYGVVTYKDIFGKPRSTEFCFYLNPVTIARNRAGDIIRNEHGGLQFQWAPVARRNNVI